MTRAREPYRTVEALETFSVIRAHSGKLRIAPRQTGLLPVQVKDGEQLVHVERGSTWNTFNDVVIQYRDRFTEGTQ